MESTRKKRLEEVYERYSDDVYRMLLRFLEDERYVDDIVQETFLSFYDDMDKVEEKVTFAWLRQVAINHAKTRYKRAGIGRRKENIYAVKQEGETAISVEEECVEKETCEELRVFRESIFNRLEKEHPLWAEVLMLVCILELPQQEAAKRIGVSVNVVHSRLHRARRWLEKNYRQKMEKYFGKEKGASYEETP